MKERERLLEKEPGEKTRFSGEKKAAEKSRNEKESGREIMSERITQTH